jgi:hypothetical protein
VTDSSLQPIISKAKDATRWSDKIAFECYNAKLNFRSDRSDVKDYLRKLLPDAVKIIDFDESNHAVVSFSVERESEIKGLYFGDELIMEIDEYDSSDLEFVADKITMLLAQISLPEKFYLHAGAVVWNGIGILIPGESYAGKTTLVKEFIKAGAEYFSDDCIIIDADGYLLPFSRALAIRTEEGRVFHDADYFGAKTGDTKAKLGLIIFTAFEKGAEWKPMSMTQGQAVLELMNNFYYKSSILQMPAEVIKILTRITGKTRLLHGKRDEADKVVEWIGGNYKSLIS